MTVSDVDTRAAEVNAPGGIWPSLDEGVVLVTGDGMTRLLDFGRGRFYGLDEVDALMLTECLGDGPAAAVARVTAAYDVDEGRARRDVGDLLDGLRLKRLLAPAGGRARGGSSSRRSPWPGACPRSLERATARWPDGWARVDRQPGPRWPGGGRSGGCWP